MLYSHASPPSRRHPLSFLSQIGPTGIVYAVEFSHRSGRDLINMAKSRPNVIPIIEDARHPLKYRMLVGMVDVVFADVAQPDQVRACVRGKRPDQLMNISGAAFALRLSETAHPIALSLRMVCRRRSAPLVLPQARIIALNSHYFLKNGGHYVISIKASCIDSTAPPEAVFAKERSKLVEEGLKPLSQLTLEPYERDHAL